MKNKISILERYNEQLMRVVRHEGVRKFCKKEYENAERVSKVYEGLLERVKETVYTAEVK